MKWPFKDPDEILDYSVDWSRFLDGETITSVQWYILDADGTKTAVSPIQTVNGLSLNAQVNTTTVATARFANGNNNETYRVVCAVTYNGGLIAERTVQLPIRER